MHVYYSFRSHFLLASCRNIIPVTYHFDLLLPAIFPEEWLLSIKRKNEQIVVLPLDCFASIFILI